MKNRKRQFVSWLTLYCLLLAIATAPSAWTQANSGTAAGADTSSGSGGNTKANKSGKAKSNSGEQSSKKARAPTSSEAMPSDSEIAAAKSSHKVWVNLDSGIYHKSGRWYGKTKNGKFMTESEAKAAGYKESKRN